MNLYPPEESEARFRRHLPKSNDLSLIVLKGHLLAEEQLNGLLAVMMPNVGALNPARLEFFARICIARALFKPGIFEDVLKAVEALNTIRNKFSHNLEPAQIEDQIRNFLRALEDQETPIAELEKQPLARRLKRCIGFLCGQLSGMRDGCAASASVHRR